MVFLHVFSGFSFLAFVDKHKLCHIYFRDNHATQNCRSSDRYLCCGKLHSALLHTDLASIMATNSTDCFMPIDRVKINMSLRVNVVVDTLSSATFVPVS